MMKLLGFLLTLLTIPVLSQAQTRFPERPVKIVVPSSAGTITDILGREFAQILSGTIKHPVFVENLVGADQQIGAQAVVNAKPDGHTILFVSSSTTVLDPVLRKSLPYDLAKDLTAGCAIAKTGNVMNMSATLPFETVGEFVAAAKGQPEKYNFAYSTATTRLASELFQQQTGIKLLGVPYKSSAGGLNDVAGGITHLFFIDPVSVEPFYRSGKIKPLLVAGRERLKSVPRVPAAAEVGFPGFDIWPSFATWLPANTPSEIIMAVRSAIDASLRTPEFSAVIAKHGIEPFHSCGDDLKKYTLDEVSRWDVIARKAGIEKQ